MDHHHLKTTVVSSCSLQDFFKFSNNHPSFLDSLPEWHAVQLISDSLPQTVSFGERLTGVISSSPGNLYLESRGVISSSFLSPFSFSFLLLLCPNQSLWIPETRAHYEQCSTHLPWRPDSTDQHLALFWTVMASEISFHFSSPLFSKDFDCFLCFYSYSSPIFSLCQTCVLPAMEIKILSAICNERIDKVNKTVGKPLKCSKAIQVLLRGACSLFASLVSLTISKITSLLLEAFSRSQFIQYTSA